MKILETFGIAIIGALLFHWIHIPLAWLLGPITTVMLWQMLTRRRLSTPFSFRQAASVMLGYMLGTSFTRDTAWEIVRQLPLMALTTVSLVLVSLFMGNYVAKKSGIHAASGVFGSVPGGLSQMVVISEEIEEVDAAIVTFMQTIRLLAVIFIIPFVTVHGLAGEDVPSVAPAAVSQQHPNLNSSWWIDLLYALLACFGAWGGRKIRMPAAVITGPLLATALASIMSGIQAPPLPGMLITLSQLIFGAYIGGMVIIRDAHLLKKLGIYTVTSSLLLLCAALAMSQLLRYATNASLATSFLSAAPGGIAEMGMTASLVHADLSMVSSYQLFRIFFIMFAVPPVLRWWISKRRLRNAGES